MEKGCSPFRLSPRVCKESNKCKQRHAQTHVHHIERRNFHFLFLKERKTRKKMEKREERERKYAKRKNKCDRICLRSKYESRKLIHSRITRQNKRREGCAMPSSFPGRSLSRVEILCKCDSVKGSRKCKRWTFETCKFESEGRAFYDM